MSVQNLCDSVTLVVLPKEPQIGEELKTVNERTEGGCEGDVIVDFSGVDTITSASLSNLLILHKMLQERGRRLVLCSVSFLTKCIFTVSDLHKVFDFADTRSAALTKLGASP